MPRIFCQLHLSGSAAGILPFLFFSETEQFFQPL